MRERTIIFATDLRDDVQQGVELATQLAVQHAATLVFLHVIPMNSRDSVGMLHSGVTLFSSGQERKLRRLVPEHPGVPYRHVLVVGEPCSQIVDAVEREGADMLVLSARKKHLWKRLWGQGLLQRLQCRVSCPVVTYHAKPGATQRTRSPGRKFQPPGVLSTLLDARTEALLGWLTRQRDAILALAQRQSTRDGILSLVRGRRWSLDPSLMRQIQAELRLELGEFQRALGALGVELHSPYAEAPLLCLGRRVASGPAQRQWLETLRNGDAAVSLPLPVEGWDGGCVIQSGACISTSDGPPALLLLTLDPQRDFFRILAQPGPTPSTETYAFDREGLMLSYSRFPDQLRKIGLLPHEPGAQTPCRLRLCDPGGNLLCGEGLPTASHQLTRMAAAATAGQNGHDWEGYRDYRGVPVVGAWRWLPEYGFGIAAEMDAAAVA